MTMTWPRLYLFAEGQTEQTFADTILKPHLANFSVDMRKPRLIAHARKKRKVHRGGGRNFTAIQNDIKRSLDEYPNNNIFFTTTTANTQHHRKESLNNFLSINI